MPSTETATVTGTTYTQGSSSIDVVIAVSRKLSRSARRKNKNHQIRVTVTYLSVNSSLETVDSGPKSIANDTTLIGPIAGTETVSILLPVGLGATPPPGGNPNFNSTVELLTQKKSTGEDDFDTEDDGAHGDDHG